MKCWKTAGAFFSPNAITVYSKCPKIQVKAVLYLSPSLIRMRLYAERRSNLEKIFAFPKCQAYLELVEEDRNLEW